MANLVARITVKTGALVTQRTNVGVTVCRYAKYSSGPVNTSGFSKRTHRLLSLLGGSAISVAAVIAFIKLRALDNTVNAVSLKKRMRDDSELENVKLTARERRFIKFASVEFDDQLYMTPQDFLESVVEQEPRPRLKRRQLSSDEVDKYKENTPALKKGSTRLFRNLRDKGIVSYTEYLFLLSILTKPKSGFRIAFNMFDTDGNQRVDKEEFLVIVSILAGAFKENQNIDPQTKRILSRLVSYEEQREMQNSRMPMAKKGLMERIFSGAWKEKHGEQESPELEHEVPPIEKNYVNDGEGLQRRHVVPTTLQLHFFGKRGTGVINYDNFYRFMDNLQTEVLELEFHEFSKGNSIISELDFAKILLRYTYLATDEYDVFLERLLERVKDEKGITFHDFRDFCHFLNNLDDFTIAMRMYTLADRAISKEEFSRAVKICTGYSLSQHLIDTVFAIFDADGDGLLSYKEFIAIMKDRLHRGFKSVAKSEGWDAFRFCVRQEMKTLMKSSN
ncbi:calcium uptake protein 3, mitochondrial isoform X2 [Drosophila persimilis]|uniref:Calcium uptake protein 3, mitochondrial isoform X4 n=1 Tax=Drosophila pseudoobscura pseudoobscura TaxID=46245 RepID=A0A6I8VCI9_DROPS|nr:calcium uptake protein 3, mitochondrial isoform X4 [Drosophila pseudoobscura]XP_026850413.1 calcium uptake protein 3, mitochondrial isoform X2 [Drosophila persimilis]